METIFEINYWAVLVSAIAAFVQSFVYYMFLGNQLESQRSKNGSDTATKVPVWKMFVEIIRSLVLAFVISRFVVLLDVNDFIEASQLGFWIWLGFPVVLLSGSVLWENIPWKLASIHAGDWLIKIILIIIILGIWR